jgi:hypothetical protein
MSMRGDSEDVEKRLQFVVDEVGHEWSASFRSEVVTAIQDALLLIARLKREIASLQVRHLKR